MCRGVEGGVVGVYVMPLRARGQRLVFAVTTKGLYVSKDRGVTWLNRGTGLPDGAFGGMRNQGVTSTLDFLPTILHLLQVDPPGVG